MDPLGDGVVVLDDEVSEQLADVPVVLLDLAQELVRLANEHMKDTGVPYAQALEYVCSRNSELKAKAFAPAAK